MVSQVEQLDEAPNSSEPNQTTTLWDSTWSGKALLVGLGVLCSYKLITFLPQEWLADKSLYYLFQLWGMLIIGFMLIFPLLTRQRLSGESLQRPSLKSILIELFLAIPLTGGCIVLSALFQNFIGTIAQETIEAPEAFQQMATSPGSFEIYLFMLVATFIGPVGEEVFFRGFLLQSFRSRMPLLLAILAQAILFGYGHSYGLLNGTVIVLDGLIFSLIYLWRKSILTPIFMHMGYNGFSMLTILFLMQTNAQSPTLGVIGDYADKACVVKNVLPGSPAEKAGLLPGDKITQLGKYHIETFEHLQDGVAWYEVGDTVEIIVERNGEELQLEVTLISRSSLQSSSGTSPPDE